MWCHQQRQTANAYSGMSAQRRTSAHSGMSAHSGRKAHSALKALSGINPQRLAKAHRPATALKASTSALPPRLKRGMEKLTGVNLSNVRVHYNSPKPALVQAHAYAQGSDIYLAPNQENHLPHELGHIAQQALGMVKPTTEVDGVAVNDDPKLEQQATEWGNHALHLGEQA